jgi:hypothetical protein
VPSLAADISALRDRVLIDLTAAHDYYSDTKLAWGVLQRSMAAGLVISNQNLVTGTLTTNSELADKIRTYISVELAEGTFQQFLALFENFVLEFLRTWLLVYPQGLADKKLDFRVVLGACDLDAVKRAVIEREAMDVMYRGPMGWFAFLNDRVNVKCPTADEIAQLAEAKATRDVLAHNRGIASQTYLQRAGPLARCNLGERVEVSETYHRQTWDLLCKVVADVAGAAAARAGATLPVAP